MTRINFGIPPDKLTDQHLLAEIRELPRIPRAVKKRLAEGKDIKTIAGSFRLGPGHVTWFNNKLEYLHNRYNSLYLEGNIRAFNFKVDTDLFDGLRGTGLFNPASVSTIDIQLVIDRISQRIRESKQTPRLNRQPIDKEEYITLLKS